jgi:hypothetical protein
VSNLNAEFPRPDADAIMEFQFPSQENQQELIKIPFHI